MRVEPDHLRGIGICVGETCRCTKWNEKGFWGIGWGAGLGAGLGYGVIRPAWSPGAREGIDCENQLDSTPVAFGWGISR